MIVKCSDCNASYSVDDAKVKNKKFAFTCPKCGSNVIIDNRILQPREQLADSISAVNSDSEFADNSFSLSANRESTRTATTRSPKEMPTPSSDFMDFDLSSDDEALLKQGQGKKESAIGVAETTTSEEESLNLDDFDIGNESSAVHEELSQQRAETMPSDDLQLDELALDLHSEKPEKNIDKISVDQDDFKPLEEDLSFDELERETLNATMEEAPVKSKEILPEGRSEDTDENITIDLDTLDIQLDETTLQTEQRSVSSAKGEAVLSSELPHENDDTDESITLDLDSLDITLDEVEEFKEGLSVEEDEDERLTLDDAGISIDQIETERHETSIDPMQDTEEELKLSIDEVAPSLETEISSGSIHDKSIFSEIDERDLPEIDFDKLESSADLGTAANAATIAATTSTISRSSRSNIATPVDDNYLDIETKNEFEQYKIDIESYAEKSPDTVPGGAINFSVDYSLSHSRIKAILRLFGLYYILFIPHFIVLMIYSLLSSILGFIDWIIVLFFGYHVEDFVEIQAKTVRYLLSLGACATATTDDLPAFSGQKNLDHAIQLDFIYSSNPSRVLAVLRLSVLGIYLLLLPHYIIIVLLTLCSFIISFIGIVSIIFTKRLPNILFDYMVRYFRYLSNVMGYHVGLVDKYPTFRFE